MRCHTCDTDTDVRALACDTCHTPVGSPALRPGVRVRPVRGIGRAAAVAVAATVLFLLLTVAVQPVNALLAERAVDSADGETFLLSAGLLELGAALLYQVAILTAVVLVIIWTWRARMNLDAFPGAGPTLSAGWAIAGWLVPFVNFVLPHRVMANIARDSLWRLGTPWLVHLWWGAWLVFLFGERVTARAAAAEFEALPYPETSADFQAYADHYASTTGAYLLPSLACLVAGVSLIVLIHRVSTAQTTRIARAMPAGPILPGMTVAAPFGPSGAGGTIGA
ncbi:protein of unknown function [Micromonospora phaseoli]|uniref:DUF4328 domain-containing protein n=1 Tax=Micromonospora phaseoli TaxID=1144548 RepID=A0A1H6ZXG0_9ACTN|nr:DUF4328 domain-containing protein [Micromonospora phaseoli]PZV96995.1 uncharacterized protein DUF4328 [Micromonospora phaseoli]GIJ77972.1 hypothetical protein Xph01_24040 [Micromonospora phaseoli]SEJ57336.1 protein of unknown function [Micromonospora phaseoli]